MTNPSSSSLQHEKGPIEGFALLSFALSILSPLTMVVGLNLFKILDGLGMLSNPIAAQKNIEDLGVYFILVGISDAILACMFGFISRAKMKKNPQLWGKNYAMAGIIAGGLFAIVPIVLLVLIFAILSKQPF